MRRGGGGGLGSQTTFLNRRLLRSCHWQKTLAVAVVTVVNRTGFEVPFGIVPRQRETLGSPLAPLGSSPGRSVGRSVDAAVFLPWQQRRRACDIWLLRRWPSNAAPSLSFNPSAFKRLRRRRRIDVLLCILRSTNDRRCARVARRSVVISRHGLL